MPMPSPSPRPLRGRFAPSPTGELHLGSLTTALASYCHIKSLGGQWLLRIEDTDRQRCTAAFTAQILQDLEALSLYWDGEVLYQSQRSAIYNDYLEGSLAPLAYGCQCSRKTLAEYAAQHPLQNPLCYPRLCVNAELARQHHKVRLQLPDYLMGFCDHIQGPQWLNPQRTQGDMVVRRQDGIINYILACSIDDGLQNITHVMRGLDILPMTTAQISIMQAAQLPSVDHWYHLPLLLNQQGQKLSKQNLATPIDSSKPSQLISSALKLLQQPAVEIDTPERMLAQAISQWNHQALYQQTDLGKC